MKHWISLNKTGIVLTLLVVLLLAALGFLANGCSAADLIKVRVPPGVSRSTGVPQTISLSDARYEWDRWEMWVETESSRFADSIATSEELLGFLTSLANTGLGFAEQSIGGIPIGGALLGGLGLLSGIFFEKPGSKERLRIEKEDSYNAGMGKGKDLFDAILKGRDNG